MVKVAIDGNPYLVSCNAEFSLPTPSYTAQTLKYLKERYRDRDFLIIMGSDNLAQLDKWQQYEWMLDNFTFLVYYRSGFESPALANHPNVRISEAPVLRISATFIRERLKAGASVRYLVLPEVAHYIQEKGLAVPSK
jgi:nicotinate-nucleotide adenylyltransferase